MSKDVVLRVLGDLTANGGTYRSLEFCGSAVDEMSVDSRLTISNMPSSAARKRASSPRTKRPASTAE